MFIAFEGPDETGKSSSAATLDSAGQPAYNANVDNYALAKQVLQDQKDLVATFDRIDWMTHMVYRLSMPGFEWNDARVRTVFPMPDTHLVFKVHSEDHVGHIEAVNEGYSEGALSKVNSMYCMYALQLMQLNAARDFELFKTVSVVEVYNDPTEPSFSQALVAYSSPVSDLTILEDGPLPMDDHELLQLLQDEDQNRL